MKKFKCMHELAPVPDKTRPFTMVPLESFVELAPKYNTCSLTTSRALCRVRCVDTPTGSNVHSVFVARILVARLL
jgi:hypothetical protein